MPVTETTRTPQFDVRIEGTTLSQEAMDSLLECVVESSLHLPDVCTLRIYDYDFKWLDAALFKEGKKLEIKAGYDRETLKTVFEGEVVGLEMDLSAHHTATMIVRAYDKSHRLHRGRKCRTFVDVKDSDIAKTIAGESSLSVDATATPVVRKWILQNNQTDWEFLVDLAKRNGFDLFMKAGKLNFITAGDRKEFDKVKLAWGEELRSFRPRTSAAQQLKTVEVRGWDPQKKQQIVGRAETPQGAPKIGGEKDGSKAAANFGTQKTVVVDQPVHSQQEADLLAQSIRDQIGQDFLTADGLCDGMPGLMAGTAVEIANIGTRFSGTYHVSSATHVYSPAEGYSTQFSVSGTHPDNLLSLVQGGSAGGTTSEIGGNITIGIVTDNKDPEALGRVKVKYPWMADELASYWARIVSQMAGAGRGFFNLPEIGDEVLVAFEHGDPTRPYVLGQLWNGKDKPPTLAGKPELGSGNVVNRRGYYSRIGHKLDFDDTDGKGYVSVTTSNGHILILDDANETVKIQTKNGHIIEASDKDKKIVLQTTGGHVMVMDDASKQVQTRDSTGNKMTMDSSGTVSIEAVNEIKLHAKKIDIKADVELNAEAPQTNVKGTAKLGLEGGMDATLKSGAHVAVQGGAMVDVTGPMVKINS